jgi:hypothetical protein
VRWSSRGAWIAASPSVVVLGVFVAMLLFPGVFGIKRPPPTPEDVFFGETTPLGSADVEEYARNLGCGDLDIHDGDSLREALKKINQCISDLKGNPPPRAPSVGVRDLALRLGCGDLGIRGEDALGWSLKKLREECPVWRREPLAP